MLFNIVTANDEDFAIYLKSVTTLFWPKKIYWESHNEIKKFIDNDLKTYSDDEKITKVKEALNKFSKDVARMTELYKLYEPGQRPKDPESYHFPFVDRFHEYFFQRKWWDPDVNPKDKPGEFFHLHPEGKQEEDGGIRIPPGKNYSANLGDYHHFVNVVAALARLVQYFTSTKNVEHLLKANGLRFMKSNDHLKALATNIEYDQAPNKRTFQLMLAGFYHDIGKSITAPRHGMEGHAILTFHTTLACEQLSNILRRYNTEETFSREDLFNLANFLLHHEQFGTLGTGEDGYLRLGVMIRNLQDYSCNCVNSRLMKMEVNERESFDYKNEVFQITQQYLFDLWLLNLADIIVSRQNKTELQDVWKTVSGAKKEIEEFLYGNKGSGGKAEGSRHIQDLAITFEILDKHSHELDTDDYSALDTRLHNLTYRYTRTRIRRLVCSSLRNLLRKWEEHCENNIDDLSNRKKKCALDQKSCEKIKKFAGSVKGISDEDWQASIRRGIESVSDLNEFCWRLAWVGKMDYALSFFEKLANVAFENVLCELYGKGERTGWLRYPFEQPEEINEDNMFHVQARFFADNYVATVIQILEHLLFREKSIDKLRNIEFSDTRNRLTDEKMEKILSLNGPSGARGTVQLILKTIYIF